jgi:hypothetical protein
MVLVKTEYISVGGNRHPAAADWNEDSGLLAFAAGNNIALWDPAVCGSYTGSEFLTAKGVHRTIHRKASRAS